MFGFFFWSFVLTGTFVKHVKQASVSGAVRLTVLMCLVFQGFLLLVPIVL